MATPARLAKINAFKRLGLGTWGDGTAPPFVNFEFAKVAAVVGDKKAAALFGPNDMMVYGFSPEAEPIRAGLLALFEAEVNKFASAAAANEVKNMERTSKPSNFDPNACIADLARIGIAMFGETVRDDWNSRPHVRRSEVEHILGEASVNRILPFTVDTGYLLDTAADVTKPIRQALQGMCATAHAMVTARKTAAKKDAKVRADAKREAKARADAKEEAKLRAEFEAKARADAEEKLRAEFEAKARADAEEKLRAEFEAKARVGGGGGRAKKPPIPKNIRGLVWNKWLGARNGIAQCWCCNVTPIDKGSASGWHCGHVVAAANGGELTVANLRPICAGCNSSMGTKNMMAFMRCHFPERFAMM